MHFGVSAETMWPLQACKAKGRKRKNVQRC